MSPRLDDVFQGTKYLMITIEIDDQQRIARGDLELLRGKIE
ncbi:MAG TPA: hypothetical protein VNL74_04650 [Methylococcus sp.]|nr:hypothetical protein [Methylococcus sp.]